jgi:hypothetical protein
MMTLSNCLSVMKNEVLLHTTGRTEMDLAKRQRLEAAGFRVGNPQDFLKLSKPECELIELRLLLESAIRERKHTIDAAEATCTPAVGEPTIDAMFRDYFSTGASLRDLLQVLTSKVPIEA